MSVMFDDLSHHSPRCFCLLLDDIPQTKCHFHPNGLEIILLINVNWKDAGFKSLPENYVPGPVTSMMFKLTLPKNLVTDLWSNIKAILASKCSVEFRVTYFDSEGDEIPIDSPDEFKEYLEYLLYTNERCHLIVEKSGTPLAVSGRKPASGLEHSESTMAHIKIYNSTEDLWEAIGNTYKQTEEKSSERDYERSTESSKNDDSASIKKTSSTHLEESQSTKASEKINVVEYETSVLEWQGQPEKSEDIPPKWFTNYMKTMKDDIVNEVSDRVTKSIIKALSKKRDSQYDCGSWHPHASISKYHLEYDYFRGRNRQAQSREKHRKNHTATHPGEIRRSPSFNRRRREKTAKNKREIHEHSSLKKAREETTSTPGDSRVTLPETPILKLRLAHPYNGEITEPKRREEKVRMGCSVTGQDVLERPNDRVPEYCALSDSDNISIISDVSDNSDIRRMSNSFETILKTVDDAQQQLMLNSLSSNSTVDHEQDEAKEIAPSISLEEFHKVLEEIEDPDNTRDSSSFELLSEPPPSPPLSIHMDEEHFAFGKNETNNYNINDETTNDKRGNQSKIDKRPYAIDAHGKIYQRNIIDGGEEVSEEIILAKRTGGAYSFVGETLPASTKESITLVGKSVSLEENDASEVSNKEEATKEPDEHRENVASAFHDSTQSFHSHTAQQVENDRQDFAGFPSTDGAASTCHLFIDHNASKGLGDTKKTCPRESTTDNKNSENRRSERNRSNKRSSYDSHGSGNRNNNPRHDRSRRFSNWSTTHSTRMMDDLVFNAVDPMHILPETIVTGAVHAASSAYTAARRVYDKILTAQTRKPTDRSQSKFGRR